MTKLDTTFLVVLFFGSVFCSRTHLPPKNMNTYTPFVDENICTTIVEKQNYPCYEHKVTTQDGYILRVQNIPFGHSGKTPEERPPILLQHGLLMDAMTWLISPPDQSLAYVLADNGFDVWLVSVRGTKYSRAHTSLSPDDASYWDWSWDELVAYDLPATFQYVHDQTGQKVHYVGHSMGTLMGFAALSKGKLVNTLRSASMLCPIAYIGQITSPLARAGADSLFAEALHWLNIHEFNPRGDAVVKLLSHICKQTGSDCTHLLTSFTGKNCCLNPSVVEVFLQHEPQPTSTKNMIHFAQMIREGTINMYDYGDDDDNRKHYGQSKPPSYEMKNIPNDIPLFLAYGGADALSVTADVKLLLENLRDHQGNKLVVEYMEEYSHADYVLGVNAREVVYDPHGFSKASVKRLFFTKCSIMILNKYRFDFFSNLLGYKHFQNSNHSRSPIQLILMAKKIHLYLFIFVSLILVGSIRIINSNLYTYL